MAETIKYKSLPVPSRHIESIEWFWKPTFMQRLKLLFGYNLVVIFSNAYQHNPGAGATMVLEKVVRETEADNYLVAQLKTQVESELKHRPIPR